MIATFNLEHNEPTATRVEGSAVLLAWTGLQLLLSDDEARTLIERTNSALAEP